MAHPMHAGARLQSEGVWNQLGLTIAVADVVRPTTGVRNAIMLLCFIGLVGGRRLDFTLAPCSVALPLVVVLVAIRVAFQNRVF